MAGSPSTAAVRAPPPLRLPRGAFSAVAALALSLLAAPGPVAAEPAAAVSAAAQTIGEYSFAIQSDGTPRFTQVLRWEADPNVRFYEVAVETASGEPVSVTRVPGASIGLDLKPGDYRWRVLAYNLLGKPEAQMPWRELKVLKAEIPRIEDYSPKAWFVEDLQTRVRLSGSDLALGATVVLRREGSDEPPLAGIPLEREGSSALTLAFPEDRVAAGEYSLVLTNPGGLSVSIPRAIPVRYYRPMDLLVAAGYSPWISLYDSWYRENWPGTFHPLSALSRVTLFFVKRSFGFFGAELAAGARWMAGGIAGASVVSEIGPVGLSAVYKLELTRKLAAAARIGGGLSFNYHAFEYAGSPGSEIASMDPFLMAGLSLSYNFTRLFYLESGADFSHTFHAAYAEGGIGPFLCAGLRL